MCLSGSGLLGAQAPTSGELTGLVSRLATLVPSVRQGSIAHALLAQQRNPRGMGPGPFLPPNNHSELVDFIWSLRSNDAFGQGLRQLAAHRSSFIRSFNNFGEVRRLLGQL